MANKQQYKASQVIQAIRNAKGMVTIAARLLGCSPNTIRNYVARYPQIAHEFKEQRESVTDVAELALYRKIQEGEAWAVCFYLKTQGRGRGYIERREVKVETWQDEFIELIKQGKVTHSLLSDELGADLATELFTMAGVNVSPG